MALPKELNFVFSLTSSTPSVRNDTRLSQPTLTSPDDGQRVCSDTVTLQWNAVTGATYYIVQWSRNSSFSGVSFGGKKISTNSVTLNVGNDTTDDIVGTGTWYWRVMAYDGTGGVSEKSDIRSFKVGCLSAQWGSGEEEETVSDDCSEYVRIDLRSNKKLDVISPGELIRITARVKFHTVDFVSAQWDPDGELTSNQYAYIEYQSTDKNKLEIWIRAKRGDCQGGNIPIKIKINFDNNGDSVADFYCERTLLVAVRPCDEYDQFVLCSDFEGTEIDGCDSFCDWDKYVVGATKVVKKSFTEGSQTYYFYHKYPVIPLPFVFYDYNLPGNDITEFKNYAIGYMKVFDCPVSGKVLRPVVFLGDVGGGGINIENMDQYDMDSLDNEYTLWMKLEDDGSYYYYYGWTFAIYAPWE